MDFYVYLNGTRRGPFTEDRLRSFLGDGLLQASDLAAEEGNQGWKPLGEFRRFTEFSPSPPILNEATAAPAAELPTSSGIARNNATALTRRLSTDELGSHARANLAPDETPHFKTSLHWIIFARFAGLAALAFLFAAIPFAIGVQALTGMEFGWFALPLPAFLMVPPAIAFASSELVVTDRRVLIKTGVVRRQTMEMFIARVESIAVEQGFLGRFFDFGSVTIRGTGGFEESLAPIAQPLAFRDSVQRLQRHEGSSSAREITAVRPTAPPLS